MGTRLLALSLLLVGCTHCVAFGPAPTPSASACLDAGKRLEELGCAEAMTPAGNHFADACIAASADGRDWHPQCIAKVTTCNNVETAFRGCP